MNHTWSLESEESTREIYSACAHIERKWAPFIREICDRDQKEKARRQEALAFLHKQACIEEVQSWLAFAKYATERRMEIDSKFQMAHGIIEIKLKNLEDSVAMNCEKKIKALGELATKETHAALNRIKKFRVALDRVSHIMLFSCNYFPDESRQRSINGDLINKSQSSLNDVLHRSVSMMNQFSENISVAIKIGERADEEDFRRVECDFEDRRHYQDVMQTEYDSLVSNHNATSAKLSQLSNTEHAIQSTSKERSNSTIKKLEEKIELKARRQRQERKAEQKWDDVLQAVSGSR
jgi:hypothetical protein